MRRAIILLVILLISINAYAYEDEDVLTASQAKLYLVINSSFEIQKLTNDYKIDYVTVKLSYLPLESYRQRVVSHVTSPKAEEHNEYIMYRWDNPPIGTERFNSEYIMTTGTAFYPIKSKVDFPIGGIPKDVIKYTKSTKYIDINDDISSLANDIAQGKDDLYEVAFDAAVWVNKNIEYDLSTITAQASLPSSWVLNERRGVCDEMTNLFISMMRSLGIPARFVSGISYTNSPLFTERWGPHGWAEVYFPDYGWVPFDPTYGQYGYIDAGHIKLKESIDSDKSSVDYEWLSYGVDIEGNSPSNRVQVLEKVGKYNPQVSFIVEPLYDKVGFGSYDVITATIKNSADEYRPLKLSLIAPKEVNVHSKEQYILLKPKEIKVVDWKIGFPSDLDKRSIYTFPISIVSNMNNSMNTDVVLRSGSAYISEEQIDSYIDSRIFGQESVLDIDFSCNHQKTVEMEEEFIISCEISDGSAIVCIEETCNKPISGKVAFSKTYNESGAYPLIIMAEKDGKKKYYYSQILVNDKPRIGIDWDEFKTPMKYSESQNIIFSLKQESIATPKNMDIELEYNWMTRNLKIEDFTETQLFQFQLRGSELDIGDNDIKVKVTYYDNEGNAYSQEFSKNITMQTDTLLQKIIAKINRFLNLLVYKIENIAG